VRVQKAASRVPSAPYNAKCHSNMSSSKGSAHVANALGSVSMCASESMNSFISCEMRRTALFEEENFEVVSVVMSSSSSSRSPRVSASRAFFASLWCADQQSKGSFPLPFFFYEENHSLVNPIYVLFQEVLHHGTLASLVCSQTYRYEMDPPRRRGK